jgi:hypothetical protein
VVKYIGLSGGVLNLAAFLVNLRETSLDCNLFAYQKFQDDLLVIFFKFTLISGLLMDLSRKAHSPTLRDAWAVQISLIIWSGN